MDQWNLIPTYFFQECMTKQAIHHSGTAGPKEVDAKNFQHWLLCFGSYSIKLCKEMAHRTVLLRKGLPSYVIYHMANRVRTLMMDKES